MKWFLLLACWVLVGCGVIYGLVHCTVPHLLTPGTSSKAQASEPKDAAMENTIANAGNAVREGVSRKEELAAR